jgi:hypothetical protein
MSRREDGDMTLTTIVSMNLALSAFVVAAVAGLIVLTHRLPASAPAHDASWGRGGDPWVASDPLPLAQVVAHETEREYQRAA